MAVVFLFVLLFTKGLIKAQAFTITLSMGISYDQAVTDIIKAGNRLDDLGLAPATSGNYSIRTDDNKMAITVSGAHKGMLCAEDVMRADLFGNALEDKKPSAETLLHCLIYKLFPKVNAVLHTHSVACSVLTRVIKSGEPVILQGYEMLKAYPSVNTHEACVKLPVFDNTQDMEILSSLVDPVLQQSTDIPAFLIRCHGIYGWGEDMAESMRVIEATEMLLSCEMNIKLMNSTKGQ